MSHDSYKLWREYVDYVRSWPETGIYCDLGRKMMSLRKIYQRVVCIPMENLDSLWREYEIMEKQNGIRVKYIDRIDSRYACI